jgi:electron transfer flavoprotein beta subunit
MGADKAIHVQDDALHGSDALQTAWVLAKAIGTVEGAELVIAGNESTDGRVGAVPAIIAEYLGLPQITQVRKLTIEGSTVKAERETDEGVFELEASLPAIVSVTEKINEPRFPSFKGIMAAKKKPIEVLSLADIDVDPADVGVANAASAVTSAAPKPPREAGQRVADEGDGGNQVAQYLIGQKII